MRTLCGYKNLFFSELDSNKGSSFLLEPMVPAAKWMKLDTGERLASDPSTTQVLPQPISELCVMSALLLM